MDLNGEHHSGRRLKPLSQTRTVFSFLFIPRNWLLSFRARRSLNNDVYGNVYSIIMAERMKALALKMDIEESFDALDRQTEQAAQQLVFQSVSAI